RTFLKDPVARQQRVKLLECRRKVVEKLFATAFETSGKIHHQTTDAEVRRSQTSAGSSLNQVQDFFAFPETVEEDGHRADVERVCAEPDEVRRDTLQFAHQYANRLGAFGDFEAEKFFAGHAVGEVVAERIEIVHPVGDHDALLILLVLEELLHAGV